MKKFFLGLVALSSFSAFGGLPSEDPVVGYMRDQFERGISPSMDELVEKDFICRGKVARKDWNNTTEYTVTFTRHGGLYSYQSEGSTNHYLMIDNGSELKGDFSAVRVGDRGDLVFEYFYSVNSQVQGEFAESLVETGRKATAYAICFPE